MLGMVRLNTLFIRFLIPLLVSITASPAYSQQIRYEISSPFGAAPVTISTASPDSTQEWIVVFSSNEPNKETLSGTFEMDLRTAMTKHFGPSKQAQTWVKPLPLINGAVFSAPSRVISDLLSHPYIDYIEYNYEVRINPSPMQGEGLHDGSSVTNRNVKAGALTGLGVIIAIIDTGVDYTHPDLGGCFGSKCKVIGGYDIVDDDPDPFDENGHGTHVAGIAAGTGISSGVAQGAKILAYRALNAAGSGTMASTIEAIQRAVNDGAHIINMSLGASGAPPENPLNLAVREAVNKGVLVVASAGNSGPQWSTVGSPGNEKLALTVGALDADNRVARFSSRGPVRASYELKPDISAPGVNILSARPGGGHIRLSGTSMSAPYVAGLAALVMELMPESDVLSIRSRIIQSATATDESIWAAGLGMANTNVSGYSAMAAHPTSISTRVSESELTGGFQIVDEVLTVWNFDQLDKVATISVEAPVGVSVQIQKTASIQATCKLDLPIRVQIDPSMVSFPDGMPPVYLGLIRIIAGADSLNIPLIVARPSEIVFEFDSPPSLVVVHNRRGGFDFRGNPGRSFSMQSGAGSYDVWAIRDADATKWIFENIHVEGSTKLKVTDNDARNTLRYDLTDPSGRFAGACGYSREFLRHKPSNLGLTYQYERSCPEVPSQVIQHQISDLSPDMLYEVSHVAYGAPTDYEYLRFPVRFEGGIDGNRLIRKGNQDFRPVNWRYLVPPGLNRASFIRYYETTGGNKFTPPSWLRYSIQEPWTRTEHLIPNPTADFSPFRDQFDKIFALEGTQFDPDQDDFFLITPSVHLSATDTLVLRLPELSGARSWKLPYRGDELVLGTGPDSWNAGSMVLNGDEIMFSTTNSWFLGWNREMRTGKLNLEIVDSDDKPLYSKAVYNGIPKYGSLETMDWITLRLPGNRNRLNLTRTDTYVGNRTQTTTVSLPLTQTTVDLSQNCIDRLAILDQFGVPIQEVDFSSGVYVVIESRSCELTPELDVYHWSSQQSYALSASVSHHNGTRILRYALPEELEPGYLDVSIRLRANGELFFEQQVSPALKVTHGRQIPDPPMPPNLLTPVSRQFVFDNTVELKWESKEPVQRFRIQLSLDGDFSEITRDSLVNDATIRLPVFGYGRVWYWRVAAKNEEGWGPWSLRRSFVTVIESTSLHDETMPDEWALFQNFPNPFNPATTIGFSIGATEHVRVDVYTVTGQRVKSIDLGVMNPGKHSITIEMGGMSSGLFLYQVTTPTFRQVRKMTLIK